MLMKRSLTAVAAGSVLLGSLAFAGSAFAASPEGLSHSRSQMPRPIAGTVASVSGTTFTLAVRGGERENASATTSNTTTFTVDASKATIRKGDATTTVSSIAVGDQVMVKGAVNGTTVAAVSIIDAARAFPPARHGRLPSGRPFDNDKDEAVAASSTPLFQGNGQPVIGGTVTNIASSTITVTTSSGITYSVNASSAKIGRLGQAATLANITTGDRVIVQGSVSGTSITASTIIDQGAGATTSTTTRPKEESRGNFMSAIGNFFGHLFGF